MISLWFSVALLAPPQAVTIATPGEGAFPGVSAGVSEFIRAS